MNGRKIKDDAAKWLMFLFALSVVGTAVVIGIGLYLRAQPVLQNSSLLTLLTSPVWRPTQHQFGLSVFIVSTLWVTGIAMVIAVPLSLLTSIYLSEYASSRVRGIVKPVIDVLSGISPVIFGVCGVVVVVPFVRDYLEPFLQRIAPGFPFASDNYTGYSVMAGGMVLSVMVVPIIIAIVDEVLRTVPLEMREASMALGATKWQTVKSVVLRKISPGIVAAVILGLSRAFGETIAVLMVSGCSLQGFPKSIFDPAYPLPALIANTYGEMMSIPLYDSAVLLAALVLLAVSMAFNMGGWGILLYWQKRNA
jgi:phosphate transport system permease protein